MRRSTLRLQYAPAWRRTLVNPLLQEEEAGIPAVIEVLPAAGCIQHLHMSSSGSGPLSKSSWGMQGLAPALRQSSCALQTMHDYCMARDDLDYLLDVTKFKTKGAWNDDPLKGVPTALKSAFTRCVFLVMSSSASPDNSGCVRMELGGCGGRLIGWPQAQAGPADMPVGSAVMRCKGRQAALLRRRAFNKDKVTPRTNIMVEEFKPGRGGGKAAAGAVFIVSSQFLHQRTLLDTRAVDLQCTRQLHRNIQLAKWHLPHAC